MKNDGTYFTWIILGTALCAWATVAFFAWTIMNATSRYASEATTVEQAETEKSAALRLHALARDTKREREALETVAGQDVISIIESIEAAGDAAGLSIEIGQALAETGEPRDNDLVRSVEVVVETQGSFNALSHVVALLYTLPIPSKVIQVQFERLPLEAVGNKGSWRLLTRLRVLTTVEISS